ncbi:hypothetical protein FRB95_014928 [Tulasnella sp. JGI-2019a]|nr:hypothetical protein FRB95_014928 [Tulasnella sp. JGI-2019a]
MSSGIPSPPLSPHGSPSSFTSDFPSLSGSLYSFLAPDSPHLDYDSGPGGGDEDHALGFSSHEHPDSGLDLILPSLTLAGDTGHPDAYRRSLSRLHQTQTQPVTPYDLGKVNILVVGKHGAGKSLVCESMIGGAPHVLEARPWSDVQEDGSRSLQAATTERGRMNVTVTRANGWDDTDDAQPILDSAIRIAHQPFHQTAELFNDSETSSSEALSLSIDLLSSPATSLYTAAVVVLSASPTLIETQLLQTLSQHVPTIPFSPHRPRRHCLEAGTFSTNDEKGYRTLHSPKMRATEPRVKGRSGMVPTAVMVVVAAALGFWAGVVVGGGSTGQVGDGHGSSGSGLMILQQLAKVRDLL